MGEGARDRRSQEALDRLRHHTDVQVRPGDAVWGNVASRLRTAVASLRAGRGGGRRRAFAAAVVCTVVGGVVLAVLTSSVIGLHDPTASPVTTVSSIPSQDPHGSATTSTTRSGPTVVVHASGAVRLPGVHRLPQGSRVVDLLDMAGGPADGLDLSRVNLAAPLVDGSRIWFPIAGQIAPSVDGDGGGSGASTGRIDINHATATKLAELPGIGPSTAAAIVAHRTANGPFRSVDDLLGVKGLGAAKVETLRPLVTLG